MEALEHFEQLLKSEAIPPSGQDYKQLINTIPETDNNAVLLEIANKIAGELADVKSNNRDELIKYFLRKLRVAALQEDYLNLEKLAKVYAYVCFYLYPSAGLNLRDSYFAITMTARNPTKTKEILSNSLGKRLNVPYQGSSFQELVEEYNALTEKQYQPLFEFVVASYNSLNCEAPESFATDQNALYKTEQARQELAVLVNMVSCEQEGSASWAPLTAFSTKEVTFNLDKQLKDRLNTLRREARYQKFRKWFFTN